MRKALRRLDNIDHLPVVNYFEGKSMLDLTGSHPKDEEHETARAS